MSARLLVVSHSRTGGTADMADAVIEGASVEEIENVDVVHKRPFDTEPDDVRAANAIVLGTPENFGYMSGALKDFFDRIYYPCLEDTPGLPYALFVRAGTDGSGAVTSVERIVAGLKWRAIVPALVLTGEVDTPELDRCRELGMTVAGGLDAGLF